MGVYSLLDGGDVVIWQKVRTSTASERLNIPPSVNSTLVPYLESWQKHQTAKDKGEPTCPDAGQ